MKCRCKECTLNTDGSCTANVCMTHLGMNIVDPDTGQDATWKKHQAACSFLEMPDEAINDVIVAFRKTK